MAMASVAHLLRPPPLVPGLRLQPASQGGVAPSAPSHSKDRTASAASDASGAPRLAAALLAGLGGATSAAAAARRRRRASGVARNYYVTGPGWTDELARVMDPREEGPKWQRSLGYRGRPRLRLLLDGEDLVHSYAKARFEQTGEFTGPLSAGIEEAFLYGAWAGGAPEMEEEVEDPEAPSQLPPEILAFVAMPADLIEGVKPSAVCDGFPEDARKELGRTALSEEGYFVNEMIRSLQDDERLITWARPSRLPGGKPRPNALLTQKYYTPGKPIPFRTLRTAPIMLNQVMGSGWTLKVGEKVEALKNGRLVEGQWLPSKWMPAQVVAVNYDGTYDLQFEMNFGPYRERRTKGLHGDPMLSLRNNDVYAGFGADTMPAKFRMMQELNYAQAMPPDQIRLPGMLEPISDTTDTEGNQDWYLCSSRKFACTVSARREDQARLEDFERRFQFSYRWVPTEEGGLRFEPVPNAQMAAALRVAHSDTAAQFAAASEADEEARRQLAKYKAEMSDFQSLLAQVPELEPDVPTRPASPKGIGALKSGEKPQPLILEEGSR